MMKITNLRKQLGDFTLSIEEMHLERGKVHGLIGPNGSGKSTLAKILAGIFVADSGKIDYETLSPHDITITSQKPYLLHDSVYHNLIYPLKVRNIKPDPQMVDALLDCCNLLEKKKQYARSLSSGEQQKLSFIRAIIFKPKLIIIDETLSNLDPDSAKIFKDMVLDIQKNDPVTWIFISHQLVHISDLCDQVHFLSEGRLIQSGSVTEVLKTPSNDLVKDFLSATEISFTLLDQALYKEDT